MLIRSEIKVFLVSFSNSSSSRCANSTTSVSDNSFVVLSIWSIISFSSNTFSRPKSSLDVNIMPTEHDEASSSPLDDDDDDESKLGLKLPWLDEIICWFCCCWRRSCSANVLMYLMYESPFGSTIHPPPPVPLVPIKSAVERDVFRPPTIE